MICGYSDTGVSGTRISSALVNGLSPVTQRACWLAYGAGCSTNVRGYGSGLLPYCIIAAYDMQANRRAVRGSLDLDVSKAAGTRSKPGSR